MGNKVPTINQIKEKIFEDEETKFKRILKESFKLASIPNPIIELISQYTHLFLKVGDLIDVKCSSCNFDIKRHCIYGDLKCYHMICVCEKIECRYDICILLEIAKQC